MQTEEDFEDMCEFLDDTQIHTLQVPSLDSSALLGLADYCKVYMLGLQYKSVNFGRKRARAHQISP